MKSISDSGSASISCTVNGDEWIASMWHEHYKHLLNSSKDVSDRWFVTLLPCLTTGMESYICITWY